MRGQRLRHLGGFEHGCHCGEDIDTTLVKSLHYHSGSALWWDFLSSFPTVISCAGIEYVAYFEKSLFSIPTKGDHSPDKLLLETDIGLSRPQGNEFNKRSAYEHQLRENVLQLVMYRV